MAQIDLKFARIYISDGTNKTAAVNHTGSYGAGATTLQIDGVIGVINTGDTFTIAAESGGPTHTVTAHTETTGNTTSITFSTVTVGTTADNAVLTFTAKTGAINHVAGYTSSDFTIVVKSITGIIPVGATFTITGESGSPVHTVTAHTETGGNTTGLTFTGVLVGSISDSDVITFAARTAAVNIGYATGTTTIVIDGLTGILANGSRFTVTGETGTPVHEVLSHSETGSDTTSITFTPAMADYSAANNVVITILPNQLEVNIGEGNLTYTEKRNVDYIHNRGRLSKVRLGDEEPVEVSMDFIWEHLTASTGDVPTIQEAIKGEGEASHWISAGTDLCEPYAVNILVVYTPPCVSEEMETITLSYFRWEEMDHNFKDAQVALKGKCNITEATSARSANTYPN